VLDGHRAGFPIAVSRSVRDDHDSSAIIPLSGKRPYQASLPGRPRRFCPFPESASCLAGQAADQQLEAEKKRHSMSGRVRGSVLA
jgi:hypothetical protein